MRHTPTCSTKVLGTRPATLENHIVVQSLSITALYQPYFGPYLFYIGFKSALYRVRYRLGKQIVNWCKRPLLSVPLRGDSQKWNETHNRYCTVYTVLIWAQVFVSCFAGHRRLQFGSSSAALLAITKLGLRFVCCDRCQGTQPSDTPRFQRFVDTGIEMFAGALG